MTWLEVIDAAQYAVVMASVFLGCVGIALFLPCVLQALNPFGTPISHVCALKARSGLVAIGVVCLALVRALLINGTFTFEDLSLLWLTGMAALLGAMSMGLCMIVFKVEHEVITQRIFPWVFFVILCFAGVQLLKGM
jgi:hypothetical protein